MTIAEFDHLPDMLKRQLLRQCCGSPAWIEKMMASELDSRKYDRSTARKRMLDLVASFTQHGYSGFQIRSHPLFTYYLFLVRHNIRRDIS